MNLAYTQFQALSACEAQDMQHKMTDALLQAYVKGLNVGIDSMDTPIDRFIQTHVDALTEIGFEGVTFETVVQVLKMAVEDREAV